MDQDSNRPDSTAEPPPPGNGRDGLTDQEAEALRELGHPVEPELVEELLAPARRERDLAILAGEGSGKEALYALTASACLRPDSAELQALVLTPTPENAGRISRYVYELAGPAGIHALAWSSQVSGAGEDRPLAQLVAGRPAALMEAVRAGRMGLEGLALLVLDGVANLRDTDATGAMDEILDTAGEDVQVVAVSDRKDRDFTELAGRRLSRPKKWPREMFEGEGLPEPSGPSLIWGTAPSFEERVDLLARGLRAAVPEEPAEVVVHCGDREDARRLAGALSGRGFHIASEAGEPGVGVVWGEDEAPEGGVAAWFGLPSGLPGLRRTAGPAARRVAVIPPVCASQLRMLARRAGWELEPLAEELPAAVGEPIARYRDEVARRAEGTEGSTELLLLEPVIRSHGATAVAAALSDWVRELRRGDGSAQERSTTANGKADEGRRAGSAREKASPAREPRKKRATPKAPWTRLFIPVGERDDVGPADLVGAITGETDAVGGQIGKIDIRESHSLVDVESGVADHVIRELSGATIRGRRVEVRRDRKA